MTGIEDGPRMTAEFTGPLIVKGAMLTPIEGVCSQMDVGIYRRDATEVGRDLYESMKDKADAIIAAGEGCPFVALREAARLFQEHEEQIKQMLTEFKLSVNSTIVLVP